MKGFLYALSIVTLAACTLVWAEDEPRDFYAEPGMNPFKTAAGQDVTENIDPFSGNVQLSYVDLVVPGNGGLDITIKRFYNLPQGLPSYNNPFGYGWTMHFGRITIGSGSVTQLCGTGPIGGGDTKDNPSIEMPDGGRELLVHSKELADGTFISKSNWIAKCVDPNDYSQGVEVTAPNGTTYMMQERVYIQGEDGPMGEPAPFVETWFTNQIIDINGNTLDISFFEIANGMKLISQIDASDGRQVTFRYLDENDLDITVGSNGARLYQITSNGQTWEYHYDPISDAFTGWGGVQHYLLNEVVRPGGSAWWYEYGTVNTEPEYNRLTKVTYPFLGEVNYTYQKFKPYDPNDNFEIVGIESKTQTNPGHATGTWTYAFQPGTVPFENLGYTDPNNLGRKADLTVITTPVGVEQVYHIGYWAMVGRYNVLFQMGLKLRHDYLDALGGTVIKSVQNAWGFRVISDEEYRQGILTALWDDQVFVPLLESEYIVTNGWGNRVDYSDHDAFGNPGTITEYSNYAQYGDRIKTVTYLNDITNWLIGLPESETTSQNSVDAGVVSRVYTPYGQVESENRFGVVTSYGYTLEGDLAFITDARNNTVSYQNYFRGTPQLELYPDSTQISRVVNPTGTVASETSARGYITSFSYDGLNRLSGIDYPIGNDVSIVWEDTKKTLTRGNYEETVEWDGFGRDIKITRKDVFSGSSYVKTYSYDALGRKTFESNPNSTAGITWEYDRLSRVIRVVNQDGTDKVIDYIGAHIEIHTDENNQQTQRYHQVYGLPENKSLYYTLSPEGVGTFLDHDVYGNLLSVFQGEVDPEDPTHYIGYDRFYGYNSKYQLTTINSPYDIGLTTYGRDAVGNMSSKQVGGSNAISYTYDPMNRLKTVDYLNDAIDVVNEYNADGNIQSVTNSYGSRVYDYDDNGNLRSEDISIGSSNYHVEYGIDGLDNIAIVTYPSGRTVDYSPDALGRPTQALPYISNVSYYPDGSIQQMDYVNGQSTSYLNTDRLWIDTITVSGSATTANLHYDYDGVGNILGIQDLLDAGKNRSMTYDGLNRLKTVNGSWGASSFSYDAYSNLTQKTDVANNRTLTYEYYGLLLDKIHYSDAGTLTRGFSYDDFGNATYSDDYTYDILTGIPTETFTSRFNYYDDAENMIFSSRSAKDSNRNTVPLKSGQFTAEYDGNKNRIRKIDNANGDKETEYVYSEAGMLLGEYDESGSLYGQEHFYLGSQQIATVKKNAPPQVDAGVDQQTYGGLSVSLSGTDSDVDGSVVSRLWRQLSGPAISISGSTSSSASFTAPESSADEIIVLEYVVTDDRDRESSDQITINVTSNHPPVADAGSEISAIAGDVVQLDGSGSYDQEGPITYQWAGPSLSDATAPNPTVQIADNGSNVNYSYTLTVTDTAGVSDSDSVIVRFYSNKIDQDQDGITDGWEAINFGNITSYSGTSDPDGDGITNLQEYLEDTDPNVAETAGVVVKVAVLSGDGENTFVWEKAQSVTEYKVYWSSDPNLPLTSWNQVVTAENFFDHEGLVNGAPYYYAVASSNGLGETPLSSIAYGVPDTREWMLPVGLPQELVDFDQDNTTVATNRFGDAVVLTEKFEDNLYRLYLWEYSIFDGWTSSQLINEDADTHPDFIVDIDNHQNILVAWAENQGGTHDLYASYKRANDAWEVKSLVEQYNQNSNADGDVVSVDGLTFADNGEAYICWRQHRLHTFQGSYLGDSSVALVKRFHQRRGWIDEHYLESSNNLGDTLTMDCEVSADGNVVVSWWRKNQYTEPNLFAELVQDTWVSVYEPGSGWSPSQTVEYLKDGIYETPSSDVENVEPRVDISASGKAQIIWHNRSDDNIESIEYDFSANTWSSQETLESRGSQIPGSTSHHLALNDIGDAVVTWGSKFTTKLLTDTKWSRATSLPTQPSYIGIDTTGQPHMSGVSGTDVVSGRYINGNWETNTLNSVSDAAVKKVLQVELDQADGLHVYWMGDASLYVSSNVTPNTPAPGNTPPVADAGLDQSVLEGAFVQLDGNASYDPDGVISSFLWQQTAGTAVILNNATTATADFDAPFVTANEALAFQLTVTDDLGDTDSDSVTVTVQYNGPDVTPPVTTFSSQVKKVKGANEHTVTLTVNEPATTYFRFTGQGAITSGGLDATDWQVYVDPVVVSLDKNGTGTFDFYSEDTASNQEAVQTEVLQ